MFLVTFLSLIIQSHNLNITSQDIIFKTKDKLSIYGTFYEPVDGKKDLAGILLLHQFYSDRNEWSTYAEELAKSGYVVLTIDLRGHGQSDSVQNIVEMLNSPDQSPLEVFEAIHKIKIHPKVDSNRVAVMGGSVGGNLAAVAAGSNKVKLAVCISGKTGAVRNLAAKQNGFEFKNTMFVAASKDGKREFFANEMNKISKGETEILIDGKSKAHGVSILKNSVNKMKIYRWLKEHL